MRTRRRGSGLVVLVVALSSGCAAHRGWPEVAVGERWDVTTVDGATPRVEVTTSSSGGLFLRAEKDGSFIEPASVRRLDRVGGSFIVGGGLLGLFGGALVGAAVGGAGSRGSGSFALFDSLGGVGVGAGLGAVIGLVGGILFGVLLEPPAHYEVPAGTPPPERLH